MVGVETRKHVHAAAAIDALGARLGATTVPVGAEDHRELEAWARALGAVRAMAAPAREQRGRQHDTPKGEPSMEPPKKPGVEPPKVYATKNFSQTARKGTHSSSLPVRSEPT
jgi:hypothetical protein